MLMETFMRIIEALADRLVGLGGKPNWDLTRHHDHVAALQ
jgi:hypothetical protein